MPVRRKLKMKQLPKWKPLQNRTAQAHLGCVFRKWEGTHYMEGQSRVGEYADCVGFVIGVANELVSREYLRSSMPQDVAFHHKATALTGMRMIMEAYPEWKKHGTFDCLMPGDVLAVGPRAGGPGHAVFVGDRPNTLIHCVQSSGVHYTGIGLLQDYQELKHVYRCTDPQVWLEVPDAY